MRQESYDDQIGLDDDENPSSSFAACWPISEAVLSAALGGQQPLSYVADQYEVSVADVIELCELYDLDFR